MNIKINMPKRVEIVNWILILLLLYDMSMPVMENYSGSIKLIAYIIISVLLVMNNQYHIKIQVFLVFLIQIILILLSMLINGMAFSLDVGVIITLISVLLIVASLQYSDFVNLYCKVLLFLSVWSLFVYVSYLLIPSIWDFLPTHVWRQGTTMFKNTIFAVIPVSMWDYYRNFGIFYEPGIFQIYVNIALFFELFIKKNTNIKSVLIYVVTIITTVSTNGYITTTLLICAHLLKTKKNKFRIIVIVISVIAISGIWSLIQTGYISSSIFLKLENVNESGSGFERLRAFYYALESFLDNPLFGIGYANMTSKFIVTFTPINWYMLYGFIYGCLANFGYLINLFSLREKHIVKFVLIIAMLSMIMSQDMSSDIIILIYIYYNYSNYFSLKYKKQVLNTNYFIERI